MGLDVSTSGDELSDRTRSARRPSASPSRRNQSKAKPDTDMERDSEMAQAVKRSLEDDYSPKANRRRTEGLPTEGDRQPSGGHPGSSNDSAHTHTGTADLDPWYIEQGRTRVGAVPV